MPTTFFLPVYADSSTTTVSRVAISIPNVGTAGTQNADASTIQGHPSGLPVNVAIVSGGSSTLPTNASTATGQAGMQTSLTSIDSKLGPLTAIGSPSSTAATVQVAGTVNVAGGGTLPPGASTSAIQTTQQTTLDAINAKVLTPTTIGTLASTAPTVQVAGTSLVTAVAQSSVSSPLITIATANTAQAGTSTACNNGFQFYGDDANTSTVYYGGAGVTVATGTPIPTGKVGGFIVVKNLSEVFFVAATSGQKVRTVGS